MSAVGRTYRYIARAGLLTGRHGKLCTVIEWHKSKVLVQFEGESEPVLTINRALRKTQQGG